MASHVTLARHGTVGKPPEGLRDRLSSRQLTSHKLRSLPRLHDFPAIDDRRLIAEMTLVGWPRRIVYVLKSETDSVGTTRD
jgi:hypothetical protein